MNSKTKTFFQRSFSSLLLLSLLAGAVILDSFWGYAVLIGLLCNLTSYEWFVMQKEKLSRGNRLWVLLVSLIYPWLCALGCFYLGETRIDTYTTEFLIVGLMLGSFIIFTLLSFFKELFCMDYRRRSGAAALEQLGLMLLSFVYPVWLFCFAFLFLMEGETDLLLWLILITKLSDIFAYLCGVTLGRKFIARPFSPTVSPKKSWEGIIGSFLLTMLASSLIFYGLFDTLPTMTIWVTPVIFVFSVAGDLAGSLIKRGIAVKDSGSLLPGIGGVFDLIDSPAFTVSLLMAIAMLGTIADFI